jgi:putative SbcD/Mre11-related phosphoesterase
LKPVDSQPALLLENESERVLVLADLHIGWEVSLAQRGIHIPSQTPKLLDKIVHAVHVCKPTTIMFLGDVKHAVQKVAFEEWRDVPLLFEKLSELVPDIQVIPGNHDGNLEALVTPNVRIHSSSGVLLWGEVGMVHGHAWPSPEVATAKRLIMAHLHPVVTFVDPLGFRMIKQVWVKATYDPGTLATLASRTKSRKQKQAMRSGKRGGKHQQAQGQCVILPSFNEFLGGRSVNVPRQESSYIGPIVRASAIDFENAELYLLDGSFLGTVKQLRTSR